MTDKEHSSWQGNLEAFWYKKGEDIFGSFFVIIIIASVATFMYSARGAVMVDKTYFKECHIPLKLAAEAGTVELARSRVKKAIALCSALRSNQGPRGDGWRETLEGQITALHQIQPTTLVQEKYFVLQQYRQTIIDVMERLDEEN